MTLDWPAVKPAGLTLIVTVRGASVNVQGTRTVLIKQTRGSVVVEFGVVHIPPFHL